MTTPNNADVNLFDCGLCDDPLFFGEIGAHKRMDGFTSIFVSDGSTVFYPQALDGQIIFSTDELTAYKNKLKQQQQMKNIQYPVQSTSASSSIQHPQENNIVSASQANNSVVNTSMEETLIELLKNNPALWNYKDYPPKDRTKAAKTKLWEEIKQNINAIHGAQYTSDFLKNKWKDLYDTYRLYLSKEKTTSGQAAKHKKVWRYMEQMSFLKNTFDLGIKMTVSNFRKGTDEADCVSSDIDELDCSQNERKPKRKKSGAGSVLEKIAESIALPVQPPQIVLPAPLQPENIDEIGLFCQAMCHKLRKMDKRTCDITMLEIHQLVFRKEYNDDVQ